MNNMEPVLIASDKSGFKLKEAIKAHLIEQGYDVTDCGTQNEENPLPFFEAGLTAAKKIQNKEFKRGIFICGTGMGMSIVANKHEGVHAAACESVYAAKLSRAINDANVLTMGGWIVGPEMGIAMTDAFLNTGFTQDLEDWRAKNLEKARVVVKDIEKKSFNK